jgi:hypothetical protein
MTEQAILRYGAVGMAVLSSLGLALTLAVQVTLWAGFLALVIPWLLVAIHLVQAERERLAYLDRAPAVEPWRVEEDQEV